MHEYRRSMRRLLLTSACLASAALGMAAVWLFVPSGFAGFDTGDLLAVAALIGLPALTVWVVRKDRAEQVRSSEGERGPVVLAEGRDLSIGQRAAHKSVIHEPAFVPQPSEHQRV